MKKRNLKELLINLLKKKHLLSVSDFIKYLKIDEKSFNKTSVYRALDQLLTENIICQYYFSGTESYYELREHHHTHLVCENCGVIKTTECDFVQPKNVKDFSANHHHITIFGLCKNCK